MLSKRAILAYSLGCALALAALLTGWRATQVPWVKNREGRELWLWKVWTAEDGFVEFPGREVCRAHTRFCAAWRTATFLLTLALVPEALVLLALLFSWGFHHRKKTVQVVKILLVPSLALELTGIALWLLAYMDVDHVLGARRWHLAGGWHYVTVSALTNVSLGGLIVPFRSLVRYERPGSDAASCDEEHAYHDFSSDEEDSLSPSDDEVSIPDDIPPEQMDFYVFNKLARRRELARRS